MIAGSNPVDSISHERRFCFWNWLIRQKNMLSAMMAQLCGSLSVPGIDVIRVGIKTRVGTMNHVIAAWEISGRQNRAHERRRHNKQKGGNRCYSSDLI